MARGVALRFSSLYQLPCSHSLRSGDFTMSVESEDPYNDGSDRLTILVDSEHTRYVSDSPVSVGSKVKVGYFLDSRKRNTIRCSSVDVLE